MPVVIRRYLRCVLLGAVCTILWLWLYSGVAAQSAYPPRADLAINDFANVVASADRAALLRVRTALLDTRGAELVVATIGSVHDYDVPEKTIEAFATQLFNAWGIGDRTRNDGVLLLVAIQDRKVRIEVGRGYGSQYDAIMQQAIDREILPRFRAGDYSAGILAGARAIQAALVAPPGATLAGLRIGDLRSPAGLAISGAALVALAGSAYAIRRATRRQREYCPACRRKMRALGMPAAESHLSEGQQVEIRVNSMRYTVWYCRRCRQAKAVGTTLSHSLALCPSCHYRALASTSQMLPPGAGKRNKQPQRRTERRCHNCRYSDHRTETISAGSTPIVAGGGSYSASSDSGTSYDYGSGTSYDSGSSSTAYDSGGSSSGDGASGSW